MFIKSVKLNINKYIIFYKDLNVFTSEILGSKLSFSLKII